MPIHQGIQRKVWAKCDVCGFEWPVGELRNQKGALKCPRCTDKLEIEERPFVIAEVLNDDSEYKDVVGEVRAEEPEIPEL